MADSLTLASALIRALNTSVVPPAYSSLDGLPANEAELERVDDELLDALAVVRGRVTPRELAAAINEVEAGTVPGTV